MGHILDTRPCQRHIFVTNTPLGTNLLYCLEAGSGLLWATHSSDNCGPMEKMAHGLGSGG